MASDKDGAEVYQIENSGTIVYHITWKRESEKLRHIKDAQNADDWPEDQLHEVLLDHDEITVEGTPKGVRWLYDWLHWAKRSYRAEGLQHDADVAESMAETIWEGTDGDLVDRQRKRRMI